MTSGGIKFHMWIGYELNKYYNYIESNTNLWCITTNNLTYIITRHKKMKEKQSFFKKQKGRQKKKNSFSSKEA